MSTPEILPPESMQQPEFTPRVENPIVPETIQQIGVAAPAQNPAPVVGDDNQTLLQPVPTSITDHTMVLSVPASVATSEKELEKGAHGPADMAVTWLDMYWLRQVGQALVKGWKVLFGKS